MLARPLTPHVRRPLTAAVTWSWISTLAVAAVAGIAGGIGSIVSLFQSWLGDGAWVFPSDLVRTIAWIAIPAAVLASSWAAAYAAAQRHLIRVIPGAIAAAAFGALAFADPVVGAVAGLGAAWSLAIPFEAWGRLALRWAGVAVPAVTAGFVDLPYSGWIVTAIVITASPLLAAIGLFAGDHLWLLRRR